MAGIEKRVRRQSLAMAQVVLEGRHGRRDASALPTVIGGVEQLMRIQIASSTLGKIVADRVANCLSIEKALAAIDRFVKQPGFQDLSSWLHNQLTVVRAS